MKQFSNDYVDIRKYATNNTAMFLNDFSYENETYKITLKKGFIFDGASIPRFFWRVVGHPFSSKLIRAAGIHDLLYATEYFSRKFADELFEEMLEVSGVSDWKEDAMYLAVRAGGGSVWDEHTELGIIDALQYIEVVEK